MIEAGRVLRVVGQSCICWQCGIRVILQFRFLILDDSRRHPVVIREALLKLIGNLSDLCWLWLRWALIKNQRWLIRHQVRVFVFYCLQLHRLFVVLNGYSRRHHASVDIGDYLRYLLHIALSESEVALAALVDHGQVSVHVLRAA